MAGKPAGQPLEAMSGPSLRESRLFHVTDTRNRLFVDTGTEVSADPTTRAGRSRNPICFLQAVCLFLCLFTIAKSWPSTSVSVDIPGGRRRSSDPWP